MFFKKKKTIEEIEKELEELRKEAEAKEKKEKPTPTYLREDYPFKAVGDPITDLDSLEQHGVVYEIKCPDCELSLRTQGCNIKEKYNRMMIGVDVQNSDGTMRHEGGKGCIGCGGRNLIIRRVDMSAAKDMKFDIPTPDASSAKQDETSAPETK